MRRIGILTFHRANNYGAQVQSFSLSYYLQKKFPQDRVEIIDYRSLSEIKYYVRSVIRNAIKVGPAAAKDEIIRNFKMNRFCRMLPLSKKRVVSDDASKLFKRIDGKYDIVVVGSDAVFSWNRRKFPVAFFLGEDIHCIKASYAASAHSLKYLGKKKEEIEYCSKALSGFDYIGVRDSHTENFVRFCNPELKTHHNCDPSLLLDMDVIDYNLIKKKLIAAKLDLNKPLIVVMTADPQIVKPIFEKYHDTCEFVSLYLHNPLIKKFIPNLSPLEWAGVFKFGALTVTEYFHGTLLSLKNSTPVVAVDRTDVSRGYEGKIRDVLLNRMELTDMYYEYTSVGSEEYNNRVLRLSEKAMEGIYKQQIDEAVSREAKHVESFVEYLNSSKF